MSFFSVFNKTYIFSTHFRKMVTYIIFKENLSSGCPAVPCEQTGGQIYRHDQTNSRFAKFYESAWNEKEKCKNAVSIGLTDCVIHGTWRMWLTFGIARQITEQARQSANQPDLGSRWHWSQPGTRAGKKCFLNYGRKKKRNLERKWRLL